jgi:hypothetical protein
MLLIELRLLAFLWAYKLGIYLLQNVKKIRILKHGYRAKSLFKYGLEYIANTLLNPYKEKVFMFCHVLRKFTKKSR